MSDTSKEKIPDDIGSPQYEDSLPLEKEIDEEIRESLPELKTDELDKISQVVRSQVVRKISIMRHHSGPIPPPDMLAKYNAPLFLMVPIEL